MEKENVEVFVCKACGYEDSSVLTMQKSKPEVVCPKCNTHVPMNIVEMEYGPYMTLQDYADLIKFIAANHSFSAGKGKMIKYINMTLDFRTLNIHYVSLDGKEFSKVNQNRHKNLKEWVYAYLNS